MSTRSHFLASSFGLLSSLLFVASVHADPLPGESPAFQQRPMIATPIFGPTTYYGHDELSTAQNLFVPGPFQVYAGTFMADDFAVKSARPISHLRWWGSYLDNARGLGANRFLVSFESDVPAGPNTPFSRPGQPLSSQIVSLGSLSPASGTFTEQAISSGGPPLNEALFEYNAELATPFVPVAATVYWLKIVALINPAPNGPPPTFWGWHNRDYTLEDTIAPTAPAVAPGEFGIFSPIPEIPPVWHFQDDAVSGQVRVTEQMSPLPPLVTIDQSDYAPQNYRADIDGPPFISQYSKDLAFELYSVPEPRSAVLLLLGIVAAMMGRARSWRLRIF
jgi:hypothetical protein